MNLVTILVAVAGACLGSVVALLFLRWKVDREYKTQLAADKAYAERLRTLRQPPPTMPERREIFKEQLKSKPIDRDFIGMRERKP